MRRFLFELAAICAIGALAETELTGRAERDNLGGDRVTLYSFGLDVLSGHPEAVSLLDGMIDYCLSTGEKKEDS